VDLVYAGDGPMQAQLAKRARALGVEERVRFSGSQNQRALAQLNAQAAVVVSPLTGRALSESALGAAPIAAYDTDWQADLIETGVTGELVPFRDVDALSQAVVKLLGDRAYARAMGDAVRERALDMLHPQKLNAHERETYAKLLDVA
jgi:glycosyltransferase involved in cell wall biosynthesis